MSLFKSLYLVMGFALVALGCSSSNNTDAPVESVGAGTMALISGSNSLVSAGAASGMSTSLSSLVAPRNSQQSELDALCTTTGMPWDSGTNGEMQADHSSYPFNFFHCQTSMAGSGPDSSYGAMSIAQMFLCSVEVSLPNLQYNGDTVSGQNLNIVESCVPSSLLQDEDMSQMIGMSLGDNVQVTASEMAPATGYDRKLAVTGIDFGDDDVMNFSVYYRSDAEITAFKFVEINDPDGDNEVNGWAFTIDRNNNRLLFETMSPRFGRHIRFLAQGTLTTQGTFDSISRIEGIYTESSSGDLVKGATIYGGSTVSYSGFRYYVNGGFNKNQECLVVGANECASHSPIDFDNASDAMTNFGNVSSIDDFILESGDNFAPLGFTGMSKTIMPATNTYR